VKISGELVIDESPNKGLGPYISLSGGLLFPINLLSAICKYEPPHANPFYSYHYRDHNSI
jgi:hypothetical protein